MSQPDQSARIEAARRQNVEALASHPVVSREEWTKARLTLMQREREIMKLTDELACERRALPWTRVEKDYVFTGPQGKMSLADLFDGRSQLFIKYFMMAPQQDWQCVGCSLEVDHVAQLLPHFAHHDMSYVVVARAPIAEIEAVRKKMDWHCVWVSSEGSDFSYDFHASFTPQEIKAGKAVYNFREFDPNGMSDLSGHSVFYKNEHGEIFHTYGAFARGGEMFLGIYAFFDVLPKGREEYGPSHAIPDWAKLRVAYGDP